MRDDSRKVDARRPTPDARRPTPNARRPTLDARRSTPTANYLSPSMTIPDRFDFAATEPEIYKQWLDAGCFAAHAEDSTRVGGSREPFTIVMPPPNVTA